MAVARVRAILPPRRKNQREEQLTPPAAPVVRTPIRGPAPPQAPASRPLPVTLSRPTGEALTLAPPTRPAVPAGLTLPRPLYTARTPAGFAARPMALADEEGPPRAGTTAGRGLATRPNIPLPPPPLEVTRRVGVEKRPERPPYILKPPPRDTLRETPTPTPPTTGGTATPPPPRLGPTDGGVTLPKPPVVLPREEPLEEPSPYTARPLGRMITGEERPQTVPYQESPQFRSLVDELRRIQGEVQGLRQQPVRGMEQVFPELQAEVLRQLRQPSPYDDELFRGALEQGQRLLDEYYRAQEENLKAEMAGRGLDYSSLYGGRLADIATERGRAFQDLMRPLLRERAMSLGSAREAAARNALSLLGAGMQEAGLRTQQTQLGAGTGLDLGRFLSGQEAMARAEERGERGYLDALREQARSQALQEFMLGEQLGTGRESEYQRLLSEAMGYGTSGLPQLLSAAQILGGGAGQYGEMQDALNRYLAELARSFFYQR